MAIRHGLTFDADDKPRMGGVSLELLPGRSAAAFVVVYGKWLSGRAEAKRKSAAGANG